MRAFSYLLLLSVCTYIVCSLQKFFPMLLMFLLLFLASLQVSGQEDFSHQLYSRKLLAPLWPSSLGITDNCQYVTPCQPKKSGELHCALKNVSFLRMDSSCTLLSLSSLGICCMRQQRFSSIHFFGVLIIFSKSITVSQFLPFFPLDDLQRSLPTKTILSFCASYIPTLKVLCSFKPCSAATAFSCRCLWEQIWAVFAHHYEAIIPKGPATVMTVLCCPWRELEKRKSPHEIVS